MKTIRNAILLIVIIAVLASVDLGAAAMASIAILLVMSALYIIEHIKSDTMTEQRELVFHDTVPLPEEQLEKARTKAESQKEKILTIFRSNPNRWFTPYQVQEIYQMVYDENILITSVRRSITDLTDGIIGQLRKGSHGDQVKEKWHTNNNRWKFNLEYVEPLNK
jgi:hypothetical protein